MSPAPEAGQPQDHEDSLLHMDHLTQQKAPDPSAPKEEQEEEQVLSTVGHAEEDGEEDGPWGELPVCSLTRIKILSVKTLHPGEQGSWVQDETESSTDGSGCLTAGRRAGEGVGRWEALEKHGAEREAASAGSSVCDASGLGTTASEGQNRVRSNHMDHTRTPSSSFVRPARSSGLTDTMTPISQLKQFSRLSFEEKRQLLSEGRPTPDLGNLQQRKGQKIVRTFQNEWYKRKDWLCGCATLNKLFCFPCLLFGGTPYKVWTHAGYCDLNNLTCATAKHEKSVVHIQNQIALKTFGHSRINLALDEKRQLSVSIHNEKVRKNREILKSLIDAVCFLGKQELAFRGNDESSGSSNRGNFIELLHLMASKDANLAYHLASSTVFSGMTNGIQNDLIEAIADVLKEDIKEELSVALFVAVEVNETTDVTNKAQLSVILRYVSGSEVKEAFMGFDDISDDGRATEIADYVFGVLEKFNCAHKLVAQAYDGTSVKASHLNGVQAKIREKVPEAIFIHCYGHTLNLILSQSAKMNPECKIFFKTLEGLAAYLGKSAKRADLHEVVRRHIPRAASTRWNSNSRLVQTVALYHAELRELFRHIQENPDNWDGEALTMASGFDLWLSKASTCFLLMVYGAIFTETGALFRVLQTKAMDAGFCSRRVGDAVKALSDQRRSFDSFYERFQERCNAMDLVDGDVRLARDERRRLFYSILDDVDAQMEARFKNLGDLDFLALVDCKKFNELSAHFDDAKLRSLAKYCKYFDFVRLKADLIGLYSSQVVADKSPLQLLAFLVENDLEQTVPEATKLLRLALTIPTTTASVERSFSALKRIKTYSRSRTEQGRLSSLALISIEKKRLIKLKAKAEEFFNAVIDVFVKKDRRVDFIFK